MKVNGITPSSTLNKLKDGTKKAAQKVKSHLKENKESYIGTGILLGGAGAYGAMIHSYIKAANSDSNASENIAENTANHVYERVKIIDGSNYIERVDDHYNLVHLGYDGMGSMTSQIEPKDYEFYGLKPIEPVVSQAANSASNLTAATAFEGNMPEIAKDGIVKVLDGNNWIEKSGDDYNLVHFINGSESVVRMPVNPIDYDITPSATAELIQQSGEQIIDNAVDALETMIDIG